MNDSVPQLQFKRFFPLFIYLFIHIRIDLFTLAKPQIVAVQKH